MSGQHYCLRWNNYQSNMTSVFHQLLQNEAFVDVTLACNDLSLKAHKVVLSACSSYFQKLLLENPCKHPTIIMPQDVCYEDLKFIIEFVYKGEIDVSQTELQSLLRTADQLKIKGLCESPDDKENSDSPPPIYGKGAAVDANNPSAVDAAAVAATVAASLPPTPAATAAAEPETHERYKKDIAIEKAIAAEPDIFSHRDGGNPKAPKYPRVSSEPGSDERVPESGTCSTNNAAANSTAATIINNNNNNSQNDKEGHNHHHHHQYHHQQQQQRRSSSSSSSSGEENDDMPVALDERKRKRAAAQQPQQQQQQQHTPPEQTKPLNMSSHGILAAGQTIFSQFGVDTDDFPPEPPAPSAIPVGHVDMSEHHSPTRTLLVSNAATPLQRTDLSDSTKFSASAAATTAAASAVDVKKEADIKFETLRSYDQDSLLDMESHMSGRGDSMDSQGDGQQQGGMQMIQQDFSGMMAGVSNRIDVNSGDDLVPGMKNNGHSDMHIPKSHGGGPKTWTQEDMDMALDALRNHNMSLTKASATYGIPSTTLWQRAHRLGIDTPKKEGPTKSWTEENLNSALDALRTGTISANKASKAYGIPSSTLYKIARREGIRLAAPFNAAPTTWTPEDLEKALESIRTGQTSVQKASTEFGIPTGTLYGRCKREGIELSRSNPTPWSEDAMGEALEAVRLGHMSINQAAIHYNLPYSSLYGRFKRGIKYETDNLELNQDSQSQMDTHSFSMEYSTSHQQIQYQNQNS